MSQASPLGAPGPGPLGGPTHRAAPAGAALLSRRALNRATLERQLLLRRSTMPALEAIHRLVGLQAQDINAPYLGLWSRLDGFEQDALTRLLYARDVVRSSLLRGTMHLSTAEDYLWLRPLVQPALDRARQGAFGRQTAGMDLEELAATATSLLRGRTLTRSQLRDLLAERWPDRDPAALAWSAQALLQLVHPPPNGTWGRVGATPFTLAEEWLGRPAAPTLPLEALIRRYLAAFGPAGVRDIQAWSGLTRLREVVDRLRPELLTFRNEAGNELFDLPGAPLPDPDLPVPARLLPPYDNLIVAFADRSRMMTDAVRVRVCVGALILPTVLVDGQVRGTWAMSRGRGTATLRVELFEPLTEQDRDAVTAEGADLLTFAAPYATHDVQVGDAAPV